MIDGGDGNVVVSKRLVGRNVLFGAAVVEHQEEGEFLAVARPIPERVVEIARSVFHLVEGRFAREAFEEVLGRVGVLVGLLDEALDGECNGHRSTHSVAVRVMAHPNGSAFEHRFSD